MGYGLLRYGVGNEEIAKKLREKQQAEVLFNYLGQFDARWDGGRFRAGHGEVWGEPEREGEAAICGGDSGRSVWRAVADALDVQRRECIGGRRSRRWRKDIRQRCWG